MGKYDQFISKRKFTESKIQTTKKHIKGWLILYKNKENKIYYFLPIEMAIYKKLIYMVWSKDWRNKYSCIDNRSACFK